MATSNSTSIYTTLTDVTGGGGEDCETVTVAVALADPPEPVQDTE